MNDGAQAKLQQELELIKRMVSASRRVRAESGDIYLVVGILLFVGGSYDWAVDSDMSWVAWPICGALGWLYAAASGIRRARRETRVTFGPRIEGVAWTVTCIAIAILGGIYVPTKIIAVELMYPLMGLMLAIPLAVSGSVYRYWPLTAGALVFLLVGTVGALVPSEHRELIFLIGMALGYIGPGLAMLRLSQQQHGSA